MPWGSVPMHRCRLKAGEMAHTHSRTSSVLGVVGDGCSLVNSLCRGSISFPRATCGDCETDSAVLTASSAPGSILPRQVRAVRSSSVGNGLPRALVCPAQTKQGSTTLGQTLHWSLETSRLLQPHPSTLITSGGSLDNVM